MTRRAIGVLPWALAGLDAALVALAAVLSDLRSAEAVLPLATIAVFAVVGGLVASRQPRNPIGWIFCATALSTAVSALTGAYADRVLAGQGGSRELAEVAAWWSNGAWIPAVLLPVTLGLLLFPDGRLLSRRWRPATWSAAAGIVAMYLAEGLTPGPLDAYPGVRNPFGVPALDPVLPVLVLVPVAGIVLSVASLVVRHRRAGARERAQLRWLLWAGAVAAATLLASTASRDVLGAALADALVLSAVLLLPVATGVAILRHRLYDIDVVINRTLVYGALTATLAAGYLGCVLLLGLVLRPVTEGSSLAVAGSTLAVAVLVRPARARIQAGVDRRFARRKYDAAMTLAAFGAQLRDGVGIDALRHELRAVVTDTVQPVHVGLWLREDGG